MSMLAVTLTNDTATAVVAATASERAKILRLVLTNRHATVPVSVIVLDGSTERARYHLAAAGGQLSLGDGINPIFPPELFTANTAVNLKQSVNQDGTVGHIEWGFCK